MLSKYQYLIMNLILVQLYYKRIKNVFLSYKKIPIHENEDFSFIETLSLFSFQVDRKSVV